VTLYKKFASALKPNVTQLINKISFFDFTLVYLASVIYKGADKSLALPGRKKGTATEDFDFHISYL